MKNSIYILLICLPLLGNSQEQLRKNNLYGTGGVAFDYTTGVQYERLLTQNGLFLRLGGHYVHTSPINGRPFEYVATILGVTYLTSKKPNTFELGAGVSYIYMLNDSQGDPKPINFAIGYRWQRPSGILIRLGIGAPEMIYFSLGYSF